MKKIKSFIPVFGLYWATEDQLKNTRYGLWYCVSSFVSCVLGILLIVANKP